MPARRCDACDLNYKAGAGRTHCPSCKEPLSYQVKEEPDTPWPDEPLPDLTPEVEQEVAKGWDDLKRAAEERGPNWTPVDALEVWRDRAA